MRTFLSVHLKLVFAFVFRVFTFPLLETPLNNNSTTFAVCNLHQECSFPSLMRENELDDVAASLVCKLIYCNILLAHNE